MQPKTEITSELSAAFYAELKQFRNDVHFVLDEYRKIEGLYRNIYDSVGRIRITVYLSDTTQKLLRIKLNPDGGDYESYVIDIFAEQLGLKEVLEELPSYRKSVETMNRLRKILHQEKMMHKLKYG